MEKGSFALDQSKEAIEKSIGALTDSVNNFESIINNATGIDEKLVAAHQEMQRFLNDSQEQIRTFATQTSDNFNKVSTSPNEVLDGIEDYKPENKS